MMRFKSVQIENFRSFRKSKTFTFPKEPGLYFMQGRNEVEPRLGSNGAAKSSIWEAITWCWFGKTSRGLKAGAIGNWEEKRGTSVTLEFVADEGLSVFMTRTWKPNAWVLNDLFGNRIDLVKHPENEALAALRLEFTPWLNSVFMSQSEPMFLDLKSEPKAQLFSEVMGLDVWLKYSSEAGKAASEQDRISRRLESQAAELQGQLSSLGAQDLKSNSQDWEKQREERLQDLGHDHEASSLRHHWAATRLKDAEAAQDSQQGRASAAKAEYDDARPALAALEKLALGAESQKIILQRDYEHAKAHMSKLMDNESCPTCGRSYDGVTLDMMEDEAGAELRKAKHLLGQQLDALDLCLDELDKAHAEFKLVAEALTRAEREADEAYRHAQKAKQALAQEDRQLDRIEDDSERVEKERNPYEKLLQEQVRSIDKARDDLAELRERLDDSNAKHAMLTMWVRNFKDIRLQLISEALDQLEIEANNEIVALGLVNWELQFDVDRETKSGSLSRGFTVSVISPHNDEPVPWEAWSGGEAQRLRIGAQAGLSNLIRDRTGADLPLEVWDEPTQGLSEEGVLDLLDCLAARAKREQRAVWVVDHRSLGYGGFDGTVTVVKTEAGSHIVQPRV